MVYEYLLQFTDDPYVKDTLRFLMTREVAHYQMFEAALATIKPNFPPGILQGDPRYSNLYFNMSSGNSFRGPWNQGETPVTGETWQFIEDPIKHVLETNGLLNQEIQGTPLTPDTAAGLEKTLSKERSEEVNSTVPIGEQQWNKPLDEDQLKNVNGTKKKSKTTSK
jgi:Mn-containing catalase